MPLRRPMRDRGPRTTSHRFVAAESDEDRDRLDVYLVRRIADVSRADVQRFIASGAVTVDGAVVKQKHKVRPGETIDVEIAEHVEPVPQAEEMPLDILYEDEFMVALNKQADLIVHPGRGKTNMTGTLTHGLQYHFDHLSSIGGAYRPGIVHRLDRDTTGIMVVAKDDLAHRNISLQFEHRKVSKQYLAVCHGHPALDGDVIDRPIGRHPKVREKQRVVDLETDPSARTASTRYEVAERFETPGGKFTLVRCYPRTGRTHQIRVHLLSIGHAIVADRAYSGRDRLTVGDVAGTGDDTVLIGRQALHAEKLTLRHPRCHEVMALHAPLPADMQGTLEHLRQHRR